VNELLKAEKRRMNVRKISAILRMPSVKILLFMLGKGEVRYTDLADLFTSRVRRPHLIVSSRIRHYLCFCGAGNPHCNDEKIILKIILAIVAAVIAHSTQDSTFNPALS